MGCEKCRFATLKGKVVHCTAPREPKVVASEIKQKDKRAPKKFKVEAQMVHGRGRDAYCNVPSDEPGYQVPDETKCDVAWTAINYLSLIPKGVFIIEANSKEEAIDSFRREPPDCGDNRLQY